MTSQSPSPETSPSGPRTLCIDIGGTGIKAMVLDEAGNPLCERQRVPTPRPATPEAVLATLRQLLEVLSKFDRVSVGFPGVVKENVTYTAPNLDEGWSGFPLGVEVKRLTGKPTRVLNDAGVQGYGVITGTGIEMILTLGTGMGCALFVNGVYVPNLELAHHPLRKGYTYEEYISDKSLGEIGRKKWNKRVRRVIAQILPIFNPDVIYLGGGNAKKLQGELPPQVKVVENIAGLLGGIALWRYLQRSASASAASAAILTCLGASLSSIGASRSRKSLGASFPRAINAAPPSVHASSPAIGAAPARATSVNHSSAPR
ncbi:MAG: ROK family protein [Myxococcales bacterium]|nr:ROK family protein [Polyangiaceae bacterium]MDW8251094.1 ROK family protein [Myxococcales bacterium]